eukprot:m.11077 g.11077  ORF g.11077 m.11077 type:complete len:339 (-) comp4370_c0_seq1:3-1019(-)
MADSATKPAAEEKATKEEEPESTERKGARRRRPKGENVNNPRKKGKHGGINETSDHQHAFNKDGYRYTLAEENPFYKKGSSTEDTRFRFARADCVSCCKMDRAPQLRLEESENKITGEKGYCMARATHGVRYGKWYYEARIIHTDKLENMPEPHTRLGWAQKHGNLQGPVGVDKFSYSWRNEPSSCFHAARGEKFGEEYGAGDVIGFYIELPVTSDTTSSVLEFGGYPVKYRGIHYYEEHLPKIQPAAMKPLVGSKIMAYKNGVLMGTMAKDIYEGLYFPAVSLYMGACVKLNFGPKFEFPPKDVEFQPMSEAVHLENARLTVLDLLRSVDTSKEERT